MPPAARAAAPGRTSLESLSTPMAIAVGVVLLAALGSCAPGGAAHLFALADACALAWPAALWIASSCGIGRLLSTRCRWDALHSWPAAAAVGACALACVDAAAGWAGLLSGAQSQVWSVLLLLPGLAALAWAVRRHDGGAQWPGTTASVRADRATLRPWWYATCFGIALPALLVAAASEPGVLWTTEFGAYDALSYHLTLPQEWHAGDGIATLGHCAYSGMPSWMESAYLHVRALGGGHCVGGSSWFVSAQVLHAALAVVAALCTGAAVRQAATCGASATADAVACVLVLGLPWLAVTGTLAYSESLMLCALAAAMCVLIRGTASQALARRELLALAFLAAAAFGAKPSAAILVSLPLLVATLPLWRGRSAATRVTDALACIALAAMLLAPWWIRNWLDTGNPLFPFAESLLGAGAWTDEQSARFAAAHAAPEGVSIWSAPWQQWIAFGWGEPPAKGAAWRPLWSLMPMMMLVALAWAVADAARTRAIRTPHALCALMIAVQLAAWLAATHLQSRFLLPAAVPGAILVACALASIPRIRQSAFLGFALLAWSAQPAIAFLRDGPDARAAALWIGAAPDLAGLAQANGAGPGRTSAPTNLVQAINALDPESARVASVGLAATAWVRADVALDWCSVWDRGAVAQALAATEGDGREAARLLAAEGWTHLAIDEVMLEVWARSGWIDPLLTSGAIEGLRDGRRTLWTGRQGVLVSLESDGPG